MPIHNLCCATSLRDQLEELKMAGKKGKIAATRCCEILDSLRKEGISAQYLHLKRTKNGEARVNKCIKYDLGNGYRLITIRCGEHLFIPFVGTHDKADLWLEHNRLGDISGKSGLYDIEKITGAHQETVTTATRPATSSCRDEYEEDLLSRIDDSLLRYVFKGLVESG